MKMSVNSTNDVQTPLSIFIVSREFTCSNTTIGRYVLTSISCTNTLLILPLSVFILYLGIQRWRRQRAGSSATTVTHSDFFTYNMSVSELIGIVGHVLYHCSSYINHPVMWLLGVTFVSFTWAGQILFPILTCVDRYLAVVHPMTYRGLRQAGGVRVRNVTAGCVWLMCFAWVGFLMLLYVHSYYNLIPSAVMLTVFLIVMIFCSLSVLRVLKRQRPGKVGGDRAQVDQSKRRAVRTILIIMAVLWLKFSGSVVGIVFRFWTVVSLECVGEGAVLVFTLAGSLVLPLLFLHKAGKLPDCKLHPGSG